MIWLECWLGFECMLLIFGEGVEVDEAGDDDFEETGGIKL